MLNLFLVSNKDVGGFIFLVFGILLLIMSLIFIAAGFNYNNIMSTQPYSPANAIEYFSDTTIKSSRKLKIVLLAVLLTPVLLLFVVLGWLGILVIILMIFTVLSPLLVLIYKLIKKITSNRQQTQS